MTNAQGTLPQINNIQTNDQVTVGKDNTTTIEKYDVKKERAARSPKSKTDVS